MLRNGESGCGFARSSSKQARYRRTFSIEGDTVEKVVWRFGNVGCQIEVGTLTRITRRNVAKIMHIHVYDCTFQYHRILNAERQVNVQVVLFVTLT
jgi:hypothetical protein